MTSKTNVNHIRIRSKAKRLTAERPIVTELPVRETNWGIRILQLDRLVRNLVFVGGLVLVMVAVRNSSLPEVQSVFGAIRESSGMRWDESIGKLSFVSSLLPEEIREVWNEEPAVAVAAPVAGTVIHEWSSREPYLLIDVNDRTVYAAASGEVMSVAHGMDEERILRVRHSDGTEAVYGNLTTCIARIGQWVEMGEAVGELRADSPLAFEMRVDGRSVDPEFIEKAFEE